MNLKKWLANIPKSAIFRLHLLMVLVLERSLFIYPQPLLLATLLLLNEGSFKIASCGGLKYR